MESDCELIQRVVITVNGRMVFVMVEERWFGPMEMFIAENGNVVRCMGLSIFNLTIIRMVPEKLSKFIVMGNMYGMRFSIKL